MKNNFSYDLGNRLRELRRERAMSQEQVAHIAEITPAYLGQVERGTKNITVLTLEKVCGAMNVSLSEFFGEGSGRDARAENIGITSSQILHQLHNRTEAEKQAVLRIVKLVFSIKDCGSGS